MSNDSNRKMRLIRPGAVTARGAPKIDAEKQVGFLLRKAYQRNQAIWQELCLDEQLTSVQAAALVSLYYNGPLSLTTLGRETAMDPATTRGVVERLRERRMVSLAADDNDRRRVIVRLQDSGRALIDKLLPTLAQISERTLQPLNAAERIALVYLLHKIAFAEQPGPASGDSTAPPEAAGGCRNRSPALIPGPAQSRNCQDNDHCLTLFRLLCWQPLQRHRNAGSEMAEDFNCPEDLRAFLKVLEQHGEIRRVTAEVDWNLEIGAMSRLVNERRGPAPLFENVKDYPGQTVAAVLLGPSKPSLHARTALALGLDPHLHPKELIEIVRQRMKKSIDPVKVQNAQALCKQVVLKGDSIDLERFPVPWIKEIDGGRYIGTWDIFITKDPDTDWVNWGTYRCMLKDGKHFTTLLTPSGHGGQIARKYRERGQPMPVALVIGADMVSHLVAGSPYFTGVSEASVAGAVRGKPVELVKCETNDLYVPANAELVIEGEILPDQFADEGPFGEYTGHSAKRGKAPLVNVTCVTHRRDPIFTVANMGKPWDDYASSVFILKAASCKNWCEQHNLKVESVYYHAPGIPVIAIKPTVGLVRKIVSCITVGHRLYDTGVVFVDEGIDVTNTEEVWWSICTRMHPSRYEVIKGFAANGLTPWLTPEERRSGQSERFVMDTTMPFDWTAEYRDEHTKIADFAHAWPESMKRKVLERWKEYGYGDLK